MDRGRQADGDASTREAVRLMASFAERTGLTSAAPSRRYLWTDAFAVCNFLALARRTSERSWIDLALRLVDDVHAVLGRYRADDARRGWISGLPEDEGAAHPTRGGLRIGKRLPERRAEVPFEERLEWDRDGQYFHYLTKWIQALEQVSGATGERRHHVWARELAAAAHEGFVRGTPGSSARRMAWKMSTDLSRPLVPTMGQHDPLDGLLTCLQLEVADRRLPCGAAQPELHRALADFAAMLEGTGLATADPLGIGGLLADAARLAQLVERGAEGWASLLAPLLAAAHGGLLRYEAGGELRLPASHRLAFRELGLAIGCSGLQLLRERKELDLPGVLAPHDELALSIPAFWLEPAHRSTPVWAEHRDINEVMLATSLVPEGYLVLPGPA